MQDALEFSKHIGMSSINKVRSAMATVALGSLMLMLAGNAVGSGGFKTVPEPNPAQNEKNLKKVSSKSALERNAQKAHANAQVRNTRVRTSTY